MNEGRQSPRLSSRRVLAKLDDGTTFLVEVDASSGSSEREVGGGTPTYNFEAILNTVRSISSNIVASVREAAPTKFTVELGFDMAVESGKFTAMLVQGKSTANIKITLEWEQPKAG